MTKADSDLLQGTLDLLILKAVSLGPQRGYGVLLRIGQISGGALCRLTAAGRKRLLEEAEGWRRLVAAMAAVLSAQEA